MPVMPTVDEIREFAWRKSDVAKILTLHPEPATRCLRHLDLARTAKVKFGIASAFRSGADQDALFAIGRDANGAVIDRKKIVTRARAGWSFHQYRLAYDVVLLRPNPVKDFYEVEWSNVADLDGDGVRDYVEIGLAGEAAGMEWGGRWQSGFVDVPHFEFTPKLPIEVAVGRFPGFKVPDDYFQEVA